MAAAAGAPDTLVVVADKHHIEVDKPVEHNLVVASLVPPRSLSVGSDSI